MIIGKDLLEAGENCCQCEKWSVDIMLTFDVEEEGEILV